MILGAQIRAARGLLGWTRHELAWVKRQNEWTARAAVVAQGTRFPCSPCDRLSLEPPPPLRLAGRLSWPGRRAGDRAPH